MLTSLAPDKKCRFNEFCAFSYVTPFDPVLEEAKLVKENVKALEKPVEEKDHEIEAVLRNLERGFKSLNLSNSVNKIIVQLGLGLS